MFETEVSPTLNPIVNQTDSVNKRKYPIKNIFTEIIMPF